MTFNKDICCAIFSTLFFVGCINTSDPITKDATKLNPECIVRKEFTFMSLPERMLFVKTYKTITTQEPYKSRYEELILDHPKLASHIHTLQQFFPWHRLMLRNIEKLLQEVDAAVTLPYWDWSLRNLSPWKSSLLDIWSAQPWGLGGDGDDLTGCVTNGPFSKDQWGVVTESEERSCLKRKFNGVTPGIMEIHRALRFKPENFVKFEDYVRSFLHNVIHWRIGGTMADMYGSRAPEFMLHHAFLDKIWSDYQMQSDAHRWAFFNNATYYIYNTNISAKEVTDNNDMLGDKICYKDPFESYQDTHKALRQYDLRTIRNLMTKEAFTAPYFVHYLKV